MQIIIDKNIPFVRGVFENVAEVLYLPSQEINNQAIKNVDVLFIRTRTICNEQLLYDSKVRFIATATAGSEHIDFDFCKKNNIEVFIAAGCNARSVAQYVGSAVSFWLKTFPRFRTLEKFVIGIVGWGNVGKEVEKVAKLLNFNILLNDAPLLKTFPKFRTLEKFVTLDEICKNADIITFHTPLTFDGEFPTKNLADKAFFENIKRKPLIINAARGGVVNENELLAAKKSGKIADFVLDCWENEPQISPEMLQNALLATPHIAGYSADGKANATKMCVEAIKSFFNLQNIDTQSIVNLSKIENQEKNSNILDLFLKYYNIKLDSDKLKSNPENFEFFRNNYPERREIDF